MANGVNEAAYLGSSLSHQVVASPSDSGKKAITKAKKQLNHSKRTKAAVLATLAPAADVLLELLNTEASKLDKTSSAVQDLEIELRRPPSDAEIGQEVRARARQTVLIERLKAVISQSVNQVNDGGDDE